MEKSYAEYLLKKTTEDYNLIAKQFSSTRRFFWRELLPLIQYIRPGEKVLDLGCGNGRLFGVLKDKQVDYVGVDSAEKFVEIAQENYPEGKFQVASALNLPFSDNYFDKVYSIAVFHHIPSEEFRLLFLKEVRRVVKPGGLLLLTVWNLNQLKSIKLILRYTFLKLLGLSKLDFGDVLVSWGKTCQRYFHNFTQRELRQTVQKADLKVKKVGILKRLERKDNNIYIIAKK